MSTHLITGFANEEHIKSADDGSYHAATIGSGQYVLNIGSKMSGSIINNNTVKIMDGDILMKGRQIRIEPGTYENATVDNGTAGYKRRDIIVMTYEKDSETGVETSYIETIKGTPTQSTPGDPSYIAGDILSGALKNQMPLYRCNLNGITLASIDCLFTQIDDLQTALGKKQNTITGAATTIDTENLTASRALVSNSSGKVAVAAITATELSYLDGVTSKIQPQINGSNTAITNHTNDSGIHVTSTDKSTWNGYQDQIDTVADSVAVNLIKNDSTDRISSGITYTNQSDGSILAQGTATATSIQYTSSVAKLKSGVTYCLKGVEGNYHVQLTNVGSSTIYVDSNGGASKLYTPSQDVEAIWRIRITNGVSINTTIYPMLEVGAVSHKYQPYIGAESIPKALSTRVEWESKTANQITVYGASTTNILSASDFSGMNKVPDFCILQYQGSDPDGMPTLSSIYLMLNSFVKQTDDFTIILKATGQSDETRTFAPTFMFGYLCGK